MAKKTETKDVQKSDSITSLKFNHDADELNDCLGVTFDKLKALHDRAAKDDTESRLKSQLVEKFYNNYTKEELAIIAGAHFDEDTTGEDGETGLAALLAGMRGSDEDDESDPIGGED